MAPKRSTPLEDPPAASSSEEEEGTSSGEEEEEEEEEEGSSSEEEQETQKPQTQVVTPKLPPKKPESDSESGSESESESDDDDDNLKNAPNSAVKPIASKPMEENLSKTTKPRSKPAPKPTTSTKRVSEVDRDPKDSKRAKKKDSESDGGFIAEKSEDTKKQLFQRLWSEDDEIVVLKGIIDFIDKKGIDPAKDMVSFFDYIKKSLHIDVSLAQMKDKVSRLKKKFENHVKGKKGEDKTFSKSHDQKSFDLSKKIWGADGLVGAFDSSIKPNGKAKKTAINNISNNKSLAALKAELMDVDKESEKVDKMDVETESHSGLKQFEKSVGVSGMEDYVIKKGLDMLEGAKRAEMEEKWRKLHVAELELFLKRNELIREQAKLMLASYKNE